MSNKKLSRLSFLQSIAAGYSAFQISPFMRTLRAQTASDLPKRIIVCHFAQGVPRHKYIDDNVKNNFNLQGTILRHLEPVKNDILVLDGLDNNTGSHNHWEINVLLTGHMNEFDGTVDNISLDQVLAKEPQFNLPGMIPNITLQSWPQLSFVFTTEQPVLSALGPNSPNMGYHNPGTAYDKIFANIADSSADTSAIEQANLRAQAKHTSILDALVGDIQSIQKNLGAAEKQKLEHHLDSIRSLEVKQQRIVDCSKGIRPSGDYDRLDNGELFHERYSHFLNMIPSIVACDISRNITLADLTIGHWEWSGIDPMGNGITGFEYNSHDDHYHWDSGKGIEQMDPHGLIAEWYMKQFKVLIENLKAIPEGDGTALDHTLLLMCSEEGCRYGPGYKRNNGQNGPIDHSHVDLPTIIAGFGAHGLSTGAYKDFSSVDHQRLLIKIMNLMGKSGNKFGVMDTDYTPLDI